MKTNQKQIESLVNDILKYFPKFFDNFKGWEYGNGANAGKDFERIFDKALKIKQS